MCLISPALTDVQNLIGHNSILNAVSINPDGVLVSGGACMVCCHGIRHVSV